MQQWCAILPVPVKAPMIVDLYCPSGTAAIHDHQMLG
jgi:hypothetical protein